MTFRKDSLLFIESEAVYIIFLLLCPVMRHAIGFTASAVFALLFAVLALISPLIYRKFITINELGISCRKSGALLWAYDWDSIARLRKSSRFHQPCMEIVLKSPCPKEKTPEFLGHCFQLNHRARTAIKKYYDPGQ